MNPGRLLIQSLWVHRDHPTIIAKSLYDRGCSRIGAVLPVAQKQTAREIPRRVAGVIAAEGGESRKSSPETGHL
jgi:hypothetical protein